MGPLKDTLPEKYVWQKSKNIFVKFPTAFEAHPEL